MKLLALACLMALAALAMPDESLAGRIEIVAVVERSEYARSPVGRIGNLELLHWSLRDRYGRTIGAAMFDCRWHQDYHRLCWGEVRMVGGTISVSGGSQTRSLGTWAVVGGTGIYRGAHGELNFRATSFRKLTILITT